VNGTGENVKADSKGQSLHVFSCTDPHLKCDCVCVCNECNCRTACGGQGERGKKKRMMGDEYS
jgi:hypothetical protein